MWEKKYVPKMHCDEDAAIVKTLAHQHMLNDSIIVFSTNNGGPADEYTGNS